MDESTQLVRVEEKSENVETKFAKTKRLSTARQIILVIASFILSVFIYGFGLSLSVLYPVFADVFNSNKATAALIQSLYSSVGMGFSVLWNRAVIKFGCGCCIIIGACITVVGIFLAQFAVDIWTLIILISVLGGLGCSIVGIGPVIIFNNKIDRHKNAAMALFPAGGSLGQFFFVTLTEYFIENYGWSGALLLMSGILANMIPFAILVDRINKEGVQEYNVPVKSNKMFTTAIFREWRLYITLISCFLFMFGGYVETKFIVDIAIVRGYGREAGSTLASYLGLANFVGRLSSSILKMIISSKSLLQASVLSLIIASSHAVIFYFNSYTVLLIGIIINGVSLGMLVSMFFSTLLEIFTPDEFGPAVSVSYIMFGFASFLGGYFGGYIKDIYGNYDLLFQLAIGFAILMALSYLILGVSVSNTFKKKRGYTHISSITCKH